jgi:hypothetical protein
MYTHDFLLNEATVPKAGGQSQTLSIPKLKPIKGSQEKTAVNHTVAK